MSGRRDLSGHVALVTGGASGIGRATAILLAQRGAMVAVNYRTRQEQADDVVQAIGSFGGRAFAVPANVTVADDVDRMIGAVTEQFGAPDILVANAGATHDGLILRMTDEEWDKIIDANLRSTFLCTRSVLRGMMHARWGRVIAISSVIGLIGNAGQSNYAAAKAGVIGFIRSVAKEMGSRNITANAIAPGFVETDMTSQLSAEQKKDIMRVLSVPRIGTVEDIAEAVAFLASDSAAYITGQAIAVDGGLTL